MINNFVSQIGFKNWNLVIYLFLGKFEKETFGQF